jgi:hypothetical protein
VNFVRGEQGEVSVVLTELRIMDQPLAHCREQTVSLRGRVKGREREIDINQMIKLDAVELAVCTRVVLLCGAVLVQVL